VTSNTGRVLSADASRFIYFVLYASFMHARNFTALIDI
jgi:hypothetical protein